MISVRKQSLFWGKTNRLDIPTNLIYITRTIRHCPYDYFVSISVQIQIKGSGCWLVNPMNEQTNSSTAKLLVFASRLHSEEIQIISPLI
jgi:hypothetical protein